MSFPSLYNSERSVYGKTAVEVFCQTSLDGIVRRYGSIGLKTMEKVLRDRMYPVGAALNAAANDEVPLRQGIGA